MLLTKENDYAIRIVRAVKDGEKHTMKSICHEEEIPEAFAYKIVRKLQKAGIVGVDRGAQGGCRISRPLVDLTLYDIVTAVDDVPLITQCMRKSCSRNKGDNPCVVHQELHKIQNVLITELKARTLQNIL